MQQLSTFQVYNASAGSGKTFTLVKEYLKVILNSKDVFLFQKILAITFTNKAAGEMKERILSSLEVFSEGGESDLLKTILEELAVDKELIKERSGKILHAILQNYAAFSVTTIDSFTHKIIRSFAFDLGLSLNFEVEMDAVSLLGEAVDVLVSKIGTDEKLTNLLVRYSLDKADDDKSWDISKDLKEFSKLLLSEDDVQHFRRLSDKKLMDFINLKSKLYNQQKQLEKEVKEIGGAVLQLIERSGLEHKDFMRGTIPKFFLDLSVKSVYIDFIRRSETIRKAIENHQYYAKSTPEFKAVSIEQIIPGIVDFFEKSVSIFQQYSMNKLALKSIVPLAVLNNINAELETIKEENNIRLNAEFNQLISENIKEQPAPFIYERIGQRFQYYFIDEMQDTSVLQWENLIPLTANALAQEYGRLLLVGDGKQAIYRWRGGKAEQFIGLGSEEVNPFYIHKEIRNLETNYRSYSEVIDFNNSFFQHVVNFIQKQSYKKLFREGNEQLKTAKRGGFVSVSFLEKEEEKEVEKVKCPQKVLEKIQQLKGSFSLSEICVLTRTRKEGVAVANYLSENEIAIISSETLLLQNSSKIGFIVNVLKFLENQNDEETRFELLYFLYEHLSVKKEKQLFFKELIKQNAVEFLRLLKEYGVPFEVSVFYKLPFYEKIEEIIRGFNLVSSSDAYIQFFLDVVLEQQRKGADIGSFLEFWELQKEKLSIVAPKNADAVQVMTIHKSKGLEFPVVIFPCDMDIYRQIKPKSWLDELPDSYGEFRELLVDYNKDLSIVSSRGLELYNGRKEELELDNFNLLYVALTRAVEQLYIITEKNITSKGEEKARFYSGIFINYLKACDLWNDVTLEYVFGSKERISQQQERIIEVSGQKQFISTPWKEHNIVLLASASKLWGTVQGEAIDFGNLFHEILSKIKTLKDVEEVIFIYRQQGVLSREQFKYISQSVSNVVGHPRLEKYFSERVTVFNEREIVTQDNQIIIPDRLIFNGENEVVIVDYKTGKASRKHHQQLIGYEEVLEKMGIKVIKKLLVYINEEIDIVEVV